MTDLPISVSAERDPTHGADTQIADGDSKPSLADITEVLRGLAAQDGAVPAGVAEQVRSRTGWHGRLVDVLAVLTDDVEAMGYLAGGRRPDEVATSLSLWAESPLSLEEIRLIVAAGGWDPEPFVVLERAGLLEAILLTGDGSVRRIRGELAGGWVSDQLALAEDAEIVRAVREVIGEDA